MEKTLRVSDIVIPNPSLSSSGIPGLTSPFNDLGDYFIDNFNDDEIGIVVQVLENRTIRILTSAGKILWIKQSFIEILDVPEDV